MEKLEFLELSKTISKTVYNDQIDAWKKKGGKVIGYYCTYIPEEVIMAAGILPFRVRATGVREEGEGDNYLSNMNCTFCRQTMNVAFNNGFAFLEGIVAGNTCDHVRKLFGVWKEKIDSPFTHFISLPHVITGEAITWFHDELKMLKDDVESHFGVEITDDKLKEAIRICNETRKLMRELYELRKQDNPPITGSETLAVIVASSSMPKADFNKGLREFLDEIKDKKGDKKYRARIMVVGSELDEVDYIELIEGYGGLVVTDSLCYGSRYFWDLVDESENPLDGLARRYLTRTPCPRMMGEFKRRAKFIKDMVETYKVDGIIAEWIKYCDLWGGENAMLKSFLSENGTPHLILEREYLVSDTGQTKTRVQAFIESLEG